MLRLLLNDWQSHQVPVDRETRFLLLVRSCQMDLRQLSGVDGLAFNSELFLEDAQLLEPTRILKSDHVLVPLGVQFHLDLKSHWNIRASAGEVLRFH